MTKPICVDYADRPPEQVEPRDAPTDMLLRWFRHIPAVQAELERRGISSPESDSTDT
jgi:hypothetical protein